MTQQRFLNLKLQVTNVSYDINTMASEWWEKIAALQMPWEYCSKRSNTKKRVLSDITFKVESGQLLAVLGGSGSGKTTLLDCISGNTQFGEMHGEVLLNDKTRTPELVQKYAAYVRQHDRLLPHLTVKETLMFVARLRLPKKWKLPKIEARVNAVIQELGLRHVTDSKVGGTDLRGISGGERRRVSIAVQLLLDTGMLFLDEPTSGLDSYTAHHLVETLKRLSRNNRIVMLSIHQPRSDIFELFDLMMLLSKGHMVYFGAASILVPYFTQQGYPCPDFTNPCDYYVDIITVDTKTKETEEKTTERLNKLVKLFKEKRDQLKDLLTPRASSKSSPTPEEEASDGHYQISAIKADEQVDENVIQIKRSLKTLGTYPSTPHVELPSPLWGTSEQQQSFVLMEDEILGNQYATVGPITQFVILFRRAIANHLEDVGFLGVQAVEALCMSLMIGAVFFNLGLNQVSIRDRFAMLYVLAALYPYMVILDVIGQYHKERAIFYFEVCDGLYSLTPYYFAKLLSEIPEHTILLSLYTSPVYFMAGLQNKRDLFFTTSCILYLLVFCSRCLGMFAGAVLPTYQMSTLFAQSIYTIMLLSCGFIFNLDNIFVGASWTSYVSYLKWGYQGISINEFTGLNFTCNIPDPTTCIHTGEDALTAYSLDGGTVWSSALVVFIESMGFLILFYISMICISQKPHEQ